MYGIVNFDVGLGIRISAAAYYAPAGISDVMMETLAMSSEVPLG